MIARLLLALSPLVIALFGACSGAQGTNVAATAPSTSAASRTGPTRSVSVAVEGMVCTACSKAINAAVSQLGGVTSCVADHEKKGAEVVYDPTRVSPDQIAATISALGYKASAPGSPAPLAPRSAAQTVP